ncbi:MAG: esterase family protein [Oscillospiraceae bacterium]|nr:esterase family protein [Oscillospiraceae bacterium]
MAVFHGTVYAESILSNVDLHVLLPLPEEREYRPAPGQRYPVLYLLHGAYSGGTDWLYRTRIACYAQAHSIAVVLASAGNSFYLDQPQGPAYERFFARELPNLAESIFPLSDRREDRYIAGLSMGGYGALRLALLHPERYTAAAALSGAFDLPQDHALLAPQHAAGQAVFAPLTQCGADQWDLAVLARRAQASGAALPRLMLSCGTEDFTLEMNRAQRTRLEALGIPVAYEEHPGAHDWDYWDTHIQRVLDWFHIQPAASA